MQNYTGTLHCEKADPHLVLPFRELTGKEDTNNRKTGNLQFILYYASRNLSRREKFIGKRASSVLPSTEQLVSIMNKFVRDPVPH